VCCFDLFSFDIKVPISLPKVAIPEPSSTSNNKVSTTTTSSDSSKSSTSSNKGTSAKSAKANVSAASVTAQDSTASAGGSGITPNVQAASVQVEPSSGSANLSIPIEVPPGRAGIQPNLAMEKKYDQQFKAVFEAIRRLIAYPNEAYKKTKIGYIVDPK